MSSGEALYYASTAFMLAVTVIGLLLGSAIPANVSLSPVFYTMNSGPSLVPVFHISGSHAISRLHLNQDIKSLVAYPRTDASPYSILSPRHPSYNLPLLP